MGQIYTGFARTRKPGCLEEGKVQIEGPVYRIASFDDGGICQGMMLLVAYNCSAKNHGRMDHIIKFSIKVGIIVSIISIALYEIFAGNIMRTF